MKTLLRSTGLLTCVLLPAFAAVDGTVVNGTTGKPQPNVTVTLVQPSQTGMNSLGNAKTDAAGKFHFDNEGPAGGPQLLQAIYSGVTYTKMIPPGTPAAGVQIDVFEATSKAGVAQVSQDLILLQPSDAQLAVNESFFYQNLTKTTYNDAKNGSLHFYLPPEVNGAVSVTVTAPGGMPVTRAAEKTGQKNVYSVDYPIKPGETRFDLSYSVPATKPMVLSGKILHQEGSTRLAVPPGVTLQSDNLTPLGEEPQTKASIYDLKGKEYKIEVQGTGALGSASTTTEEDSGAPKIEEIQPRIYNNLGWILGIALGILALGLFLLYRSKTPEADTVATELSFNQQLREKPRAKNLWGFLFAFYRQRSTVEPAREPKRTRKGAASR